MEIKFSLNNKRVQLPLNVGDFSIELNFDRDNPFKPETVSLNEWEFGVGDYSDAEDPAIVLDDWFENLPGPLEGCPFQIQLSNLDNTSTVYDGIVDTSLRIFECNKVIVPSKEIGGLDWFNAASQVTYDYLATPTAKGGYGNIEPSDYVMVPYVIDNLDPLELFVATFYMGTIVYQLINVTTDISGTIASLAGVFTFGNLFMLIVQIAYAVFLVVSIVIMILDIITMLIQPVKYFASMFVSKLLEKGCEYLGYTFESSVFLEGELKQLAIIPPKRRLPVNAQSQNILGFLLPDKTVQNGYYQGSLQSLISALKTTFNLKQIVDTEKKIFRLEKLDYREGSPLFVMPDVKLEPTRVNRDDFYSQINVSFTTDLQDKWTIQQYEGTEVQINQVPITIQNRQAVLADGLLDAKSPFALAKKKKELTRVEEVVLRVAKLLDPLLGAIVKLVNAAIPTINTLIRLINKIIKALNKIPGVRINVNLREIKPIKFKSLAQTIEDRIGMVKVESDYFAIHKLVLIPDNTDPRSNRLLDTNETVLNADYIWENYFKSVSFDPLDSDNNQRTIEQALNVPVCYEDYLKVKRNSFMETSKGEVAEIISFLYKPKANLADIKFKLKRNWATNLTLNKIIPDGS